MTMMMITKAVSNSMGFFQHHNKNEKKKNGNNKMPTTTKNGILNDKTSNSNILTNKVQPSSSLTSSTTMTVESIEPGLMILRNFVNDEECQRIAQMAERLGKEQEESSGDGGFYTFNEKTGKKELNTGEARGRIYDAATKFPPSLIQKCDDAVTVARLQDEDMPTMDCTHVLLNMYTTSQGLTWHRDIYENDGKSDHPVVNLCIGASCLFGFKHDDTDEDRTVVLKNGDVLLFGGPCRLIKHAVLEVLLDDCPLWMKETNDHPCRYSFTFRDSPEVLGREEEFKFFRVSEHLVGQTEFQVPENRKSFRGLPSLKSQRMDSLTSTSTRTSATTLILDDDTTETTAFDESEVSYNWDATDDHVITTPQS